jgi:hypothetical protein
VDGGRATPSVKHPLVASFLFIEGDISVSTGGEKRSFLSKEESFMYDRETRFPMEDTMNAGRIEYTEKGVMNMASRRCDIIRISRSGAILALLTKYTLPEQFYLDLPDARLNKIGCMLMRVYANNTIEVRFLRILAEKEMNRIFVYSTHPAHRDRVLDVRSW